MTHQRLRASTVAVLLLWGASAASAQLPPEATTWIDLPAVDDTENTDEFRNFKISDVGLVDVIVSGEYARAFYTTLGFLEEDLGGNPIALYENRLRPVDLHLPVPDLTSFDGVPWLQGPPGSEAWLVRSHVENWNQVLDDIAEPTGPFFAKTGSVVGILSHNGTLFVGSGSRRDFDASASSGGITLWNGVAMLDGTADPASAFDPAAGVGKELYSAGDGPTGDPDAPTPQTPGYDPPSPEDTGMLRAVPEGSWIAETDPQGAPMARFLFVSNYCGEDYAGTLLVQDISSLTGVRRARRIIVPIFDYLGDYTDNDAVMTAGPDAPFGAEVPSEHSPAAVTSTC